MSCEKKIYGKCLWWREMREKGEKRGKERQRERER